MSIYRRISNLFSRSRMEEDIDAELQSHLEMRIEDSIAAGMSPDAARRDARLRFGNPAVVRDHIAVEDVAPMLEIFVFNVRYALRQFARNRTFTIAVMLTIALGIGLNTAMFSVIRAVLLEPLGYRAPERLVLLSNSATPVRFEEMLASAHSYDGLGAFSGGREDLALSGDGQPEVLRGSRVSGNFLDILGVPPLLGRGFLSAEDKPGAPPVAMISAELWRQRFNGAPSILGRSMTLAGTAYTIVGILPPKFQFPRARTDVWLTQPSEWSAIEPASRRISPILHIFGRLKPGVDLEAANAELTVIDNQYAAAHPAMIDTDKSLARMGNRVPNHLEFLKDNLVSDVRPKLWLLFGAVGLVLLIMCANIASLLLARSKARSRDFAVRAAIGAGRGRIVGQLLTESMLLSLIGGTLGVALAELAVRGVRGMTALNLPRSGEIRIDGTVLSFAVIVSLLTGLVFGLLPAVSASRPDLAGVLRGSGEGASTTGAKSALLRINPRSLLVLGQVALSTVLLIGAALLIESLAHVYRVDPGFEVSNLLTMNITLPTARYGSDEKRAAFYSELLEKVEAVPGVQSAAVARTLPMTPYPAAPIQVSGRPEMKLNERPFAGIQNISPRYFQTLKIPLKRGREFTAHDDAGAVPVAIIDESMARRFWPQYPAGPNPIGDRILIGSHSQPTEIVAIVANIAQGGLTQKPQPGVYLSAAQQPLESAVLVLRTESEPLSFANAVRNQILSIDRDQPVSEVASMNEVMDASEGPLRVMMMLLGLFAAVATIIAVVGLYGVIAYSVAQRTKEIGIRRALGAQRGSILTLIVGHGFRLALGGVLLGIGGAFALSRVLHGLLFQVSTTDPTTYIGIAILFIAVALAASYIPARRAASIDPLETLRL